MADDYTRPIASNAEYRSPGWWVLRLEKRMEGRKAELERYDDYYTGKHPMALQSQQFRKEFAQIFMGDVPFADNWCELVVDATEERLNVEGFRIDPEDPQDDKDAWRIWQENSLDLYSQVAHSEALVESEAYVLVSPFEKVGSKDSPLITIEHPQQMVVEYQAGSYNRVVTAAWKRWLGDDGFSYGTLYMPDNFYKFRSLQKTPNEGGEAKWVRREVTVGNTAEAWPLPNPLGRVPVVPLCNKPRLLHPATSELRKVIPLQNAINKVTMDLIVASEFMGYRQRIITGLELQEDEQGNPVNPVKASADRWIYLNGDGETPINVHDLNPTPLDNYYKTTESLIQHVAAQTRTPPHYFWMVGQAPSGDSIKSSETGLVTKVARRARVYGESWEDVMRMAFAVMNDDRQNALQSETVWGDMESRSEGEHIDATLKKKALDIPLEQLWEDAGYTPQQITRFKEMRAAEPPVPAQPVPVPSPGAMPGAGAMPGT